MKKKSQCGRSKSFGRLSFQALAVALPVLSVQASTPLDLTIQPPATPEDNPKAIFTGGELSSPLIMPIAPDPKDDSKLRKPIIGGNAVDLSGLPSVIHGAFDGGKTGDHADAEVELNKKNLSGGNSFDIPSGGKPSPLFSAKPWTQKLILFEEFGTEPMGFALGTPTLPKPVAGVAPEQNPNALQSSPGGSELEAFLRQDGFYPYPSRQSRTDLPNPWWSQICQYLGRADCSKAGPLEGRPPGEGWAHQRWSEFQPARGFKTVQAGARTNLGFRSERQMHGYRVGEFAPGGLYHNPAGLPSGNGTTAGIKIQFHPAMPVQSHKSIWTFDGTLPPKLLMARMGEPILMRHYNALPIDVSANRGFGLHTISTHEHNGHNPGESDGYAGAFFFPGQFYDYRWPLVLAGHDTINTDASDERASLPCVAGEIVQVPRKSGLQSFLCDTSADPAGKAGRVRIRGDFRETMSTHWFHDHMLDYTSQNVYKGNGAMYNIYSGLDRGNETLSDGVNLRLPSGSALPWGNRDYDVNLVIGDKAWDAEGQLWFDPFNRDGFLGDQVLVNWQYRPVLQVRSRRYRFRILNGAVARYMKFALVREVSGTTGSLKGPSKSTISYERVPFHLIANDGNLMEHAVAFDGTLGTQAGELPTQAIGERYDIVVDFSKNGVKAGDKLYFVNLLEHKDGRRPNSQVKLADVLSGGYQPTRTADRWENGDPAVGAFLRIDVVPCVNKSNVAVACVDPSSDPARFVLGNKLGPNGTDLKLLERPSFTAEELANARHRTYSFGKSSGTDTAPWTVKTDGGSSFKADTRRVSAAPNLGNLDAKGQARVEIWHLENGGGGWSHPVHVHFEEGQILNRDGKIPPIWERFARKDMFRVGNEPDASDKVAVAYRFREFSGSYVEHCHNTTHEDHAMLLRWDIEKPGQTLMMPSPIPTWDGVKYVDSVAVETAR